MKHRNLIVLIVAVVLAALVTLPTLYVHQECNSYIENIDAVKAALERHDFDEAYSIFQTKIGKWEDENEMILEFMEHTATERVKDYVIQLDHNLRNKQYELSLERVDLLKAEMVHLQRSSYLIPENIL